MAYIEKEPIIEFITKGLNNPDKSEAYGYDAVEILTEIEYTPTADVVEVRHAKFELVSGGKGVCSNCHRLDSIDKLAKYCRYCGAKMDESGADIYVGSRKE